MTAGGNTLDDAIGKLDGLLLDMEKEAQSAGVKIPELRFDPDDPWAKERSLPPPYVVKVRCPKTGYLMTKPFEAQCPMPDAFVKDNSYLKGMINPVVKPANQAPAPSTSKSKSKTVVVGEVEDFAKVLFKVSRSLFLLRFFLLFPFSLSLRNFLRAILDLSLKLISLSSPSPSLSLSLFWDHRLRGLLA